MLVTNSQRKWYHAIRIGIIFKSDFFIKIPLWSYGWRLQFASKSKWLRSWGKIRRTSNFFIKNGAQELEVEDVEEEETDESRALAAIIMKNHEEIQNLQKNLVQLQ